MNSTFEMYKKATVNAWSQPLYERKKIPILKSFAAGLDPTGMASFAIGRRASNHKTNQVVGAAAGALSGVALLPSSVGGTIGAIKGFLKTKGNIRKKLVGSVAGGSKGAVASYKDLYHGLQVGKHLNISQRAGRLTPKTIYHLKKALGTNMSESVSHFTLNSSKLFGKTKTFSTGVGELKRLIGDRSKTVAMGLGASGVIGGMSPVVQYSQGKKIGDEEIKFNKTLKYLQSIKNNKD